MGENPYTDAHSDPRAATSKETPMKTILTVLALLLALQGERKTTPQFEQLKKLEGVWESSDKEHPTTITYKVGSAGTIVNETISMGKAGDMLTVYHLEG